MAGFEVTTYGRFCGDHRGQERTVLPDRILKDIFLPPAGWPSDVSSVNYLCHQCGLVSSPEGLNGNLSPAVARKTNRSQRSKAVWKAERQCGHRDCGQSAIVFYCTTGIPESDALIRERYENASLPPCDLGHQQWGPNDSNIQIGATDEDG